MRGTKEGPLVAADEWFGHQIVETHAHVGDSDRSWTEKVCAMAGARDGSISLGFGAGKYTNRNVFDAYAAVSRGKEQWTVRASRRLADDLDSLHAGPVGYEIVEPLRVVRFTCAPTDEHPIAFDWTFEGVVPPILEERHRQRERGAFRRDIHLLRYHQTGLATGWVELEGQRTEITRDGWFTTRDHSWGVRHDVGQPVDGVEPAGLIDGVSFRFTWCPMLMQRPDGTMYAIHHQHSLISAFGYLENHIEGGVEHSDGTVEAFAGLAPNLDFDPVNRRVLGGTFDFTMADGTHRPITVRAMAETGVHLGAGGYFGYRGHRHGDYHGLLHVEHDHVADCTTPEAARDLHQIRDALMYVEDPVGGGLGWCNLQTIMVGAWPETGLDEESSFI